MTINKQNKKIFIFNKKKSGYTILELLFYISFFTVFILVVINAMIMMAKSFKETTIQAEFVQSGDIMERISREIRQADSISSLVYNPGDLRLNTTDSSGVAKTIEFRFVSPNIQLWYSGVNVGNLNAQNIVVTALTFTEITTTNSKAVKIFLTIRSNHDISNRTVDFYDTIVLRGSY